jgi:hypothetical protein
MVSSMRLDVHGHPLHTRSLSITIAQRADGALDVQGVVLDLRKRGFVPVGGDLQGSGIIHHMLLDGVVDPASTVLRTIAARQPSVAFEPSIETGGESCRDPVERVRALAGARLDDDWARRLGAEIGGPRGCSHILTLAQLLGPTVVWALERTRTLGIGWPEQPAGQRVFRRDVIVDGHEVSAGRVALALQLTDLHWAPAPPLARTMDRFAAALEVRALAGVDMATYSLATLRVAERRRVAADFETAPWRDRSAAVEGLVDLGLARGVTAELLARLGGSPDDRPLLDGLLMLAPALIQVMAALSEAFPKLARQQGWLMGMGGRPDSCWMWREGGALLRARTANDPPLQPR